MHVHTHCDESNLLNGCPTFFFLVCLIIYLFCRTTHHTEVAVINSVPSSPNDQTAAKANQELTPQNSSLSQPALSPVGGAAPATRITPSQSPSLARRGLQGAMTETNVDTGATSEIVIGVVAKPNNVEVMMSSSMDQPKVVDMHSGMSKLRLFCFEDKKYAMVGSLEIIAL